MAHVTQKGYQQAYSLNAFSKIIPPPIFSSMTPTATDQPKDGRLWVVQTGVAATEAAYIKAQSVSGSAVWLGIGGAVPITPTSITTAGLITGTGGMTLTGATLINTTGTGTTTIGNASAAFNMIGLTLGITGAATITGALTQTAGNVTIGDYAGAQTLKFGTGGAGAGAKTVTVGSTQTGSTTTLQSEAGVPVVAASGLTASAGVLTGTGLTATNGDVTLSTAGKTLKIKVGGAGADALGTSVMSSTAAGKVTVATTAVTANSYIFVTYGTLGGTPGVLSVPTAGLVAGTSFDILSSGGAGDTSDVNWFIINPS